MTDIQFHSAARSELLDAATFYEEQADGLGGQFIDEAQRVLDLLAGSPGLGLQVAGRGGLRRWSLRRFPYYVIYRVSRETLFVLAVAHERQRPGYWSDRS